MTVVTCLDRALWMLDRDLWPVLIHPGAKKPIGFAWGKERPTVSTIQQGGKRHPKAGVGVLLGCDGGVVDFEIDADDPETIRAGEKILRRLFNGEPPATFGWVSRRGPHRLYRYSPELARLGKSIIHVGPVELRLGAHAPGERQIQSVLPPTPDENGRRREHNGVETIADLPPGFVDRLAAMLAEAESPKPAPSVDPDDIPILPRANGVSRWFRKQLEGEAGKVAMAAEGSRHAILLKAAKTVGGNFHHGVIGEQEAAGILEAAAMRAGLSEAEARETIRDGFQYGKAAPLDWPARLERPAPPRRKAPQPSSNGSGAKGAHDANGQAHVVEEAPAPPITTTDDRPTTDRPPQTGAQIILDYFRERYRPVFRRGHSVACQDGELLTQGVGCGTPTSVLIARLESAADAPLVNGGINRGQLPKFFRTWAPVAWGDLLASLPDEDTADLGADAPAREEFRRLVREAMLSEVVLGDVIGNSGVTQVERRSLIDWCQRFAKTGPWRSIRSKKCWCKLRDLGDGEVELAVAIRHELFAQIGADRRLREMSANTFTRRVQRYGVGTSGGREDRPHGLSAVVLDSELVRDLLANTPELDDVVAESEATPHD